eukprot:scaffold10456_cov45-Cyclotella_meneghiniana.AAC.7
MNEHQVEAKSADDNVVARLLEHDRITYGFGNGGQIILDGENIAAKDSMDVMVKVIQKSTNLYFLKILDLLSTKFTDRDTNCLADALRANTTIEELFLVCIRVSNDAFQYLADSLKVNRGIRKLNLVGNFRIADLADSLKVNTTLSAVHLHCFGSIDKECVKSLADVINVNRSLNAIGLTISRKLLDQIGVEESIALMSAIIKNGSLKFKLNDGWPSKCISYSKGGSLVNWLGEISKSYKNEIDEKNNEIKSLKSEKIASLQSEIEKKNKQIISLKSAIRGSMEQLNMILEPIDLTGDGESEPPAKRPRNGMPATKSKLSIMHEQNQKMIKVKMEKNDAEANLKVVTEEKEFTKVELEDTREDLDIANETVQQQALATDIWQRKFDELAALVAAGKVDGAAVAAIRNRSLADQR